MMAGGWIDFADAVPALTRKARERLTQAAMLRRIAIASVIGTEAASSARLLVRLAPQGFRFALGGDLASLTAEQREALARMGAVETPQ